MSNAIGEKYSAFLINAKGAEAFVKVLGIHNVQEAGEKVKSFPGFECIIKHIETKEMQEMELLAFNNGETFMIAKS